MNWVLVQAIRVLRLRVEHNAKRHGVTYSFLFMKASGDQLREIRTLVDSGVIRPVIDRVFPFESTFGCACLRRKRSCQRQSRR